jgi:hypothetical protein
MKASESVIVHTYLGFWKFWREKKVEIIRIYKCRKINVFQVGGLVGKNLRNLEKIK